MSQLEIVAGSFNEFPAETRTAVDISIELPFELIQVLRLVHALVEAGCRIHVSPADASKLSQLQKIFGMPYVVDVGNTPILRGVSVDHMSPETRVGAIARPLIFPIAAFDYCRARWPQSRKVRASFAGAATATRTQTINTWLKLSNLPTRIPDWVGDRTRRSLARRITDRLTRQLAIQRRTSIRVEGVEIIFSNEGRTFPRKAWNVGYFAGLLESEFVLCPDGDFGQNNVAWTYRFFESALCGAIPVVQHSCSAYEGFRFQFMDKPLKDLRWSRDDAEYNFNLALERLTVPSDELRSEVTRLLQNPAAAPRNGVRHTVGT